jgi:hypothetical protein
MKSPRPAKVDINNGRESGALRNHGGFHSGTRATERLLLRKPGVLYFKRCSQVRWSKPLRGKERRSAET